VTPATFRLLDGVADSINPLLAVMGLAAPFLRRPRALRTAIAFYLSAGAAMGFVYAIRAVDIDHQIWARFGLDFSTHSAFAGVQTTAANATYTKSHTNTDPPALVTTTFNDGPVVSLTFPPGTYLLTTSLRLFNTANFAAANNSRAAECTFLGDGDRYYESRPPASLRTP
jgi:hypothetical protein